MLFMIVEDNPEGKQHSRKSRISYQEKTTKFYKNIKPRKTPKNVLIEFAAISMLDRIFHALTYDLSQQAREKLKRADW